MYDAKGSMTMGRACPLGYFAALLLCAYLAGVPATQALEDGRIGVLYVGCIARSRPFWLMRSDPLFSFTFVQATLRDWAGWGPIMQAEQEPEVYRMVRLYMPRSFGHLVEGYDAIVFANANRFAVGQKFNRMLARGVEEGGLSMLMSGGWESFGGAFGRPAWGETEVGALLPTEDVVDTWVQYPRGYILFQASDREHELMSSLRWEPRAPWMNNYHHNLVTVRPGGRVLAQVESLRFKNHPGIVTWDLENEARVVAMTGEIHASCWGIDPWEYAIDLGSNMMIYLDGRPVPQDIELVHTVRMKMFQVATRKSLLLSLLEFCDSFGANVQSVVSMIDEIDLTIWEARPVYFDLRFDEVLEVYLEVEEMLTSAEQESIRLKDRALLWVYIIEWLVVSATMMVTGFVLWTTMVRRRLFREVETTRLTGEHSDD